MARTEVRIAGFGGQGVVLTGVLLGTAATLHEDRHAVQTQTYGAAARGGAARSDVIISDEFILYPQVMQPDILAAMSTPALAKYRDSLSPGGTLIIDSDLVELPGDTGDVGDVSLHTVRATHIATEEFGKGIVANMVMLGAIVAVSGVVSVDAVRAAIMAGVPAGTEELNLKAFERGIEAVG
jgi:2-oxoglutarate ferredoxin oxidoreductase subunit gamma